MEDCLALALKQLPNTSTAGYCQDFGHTQRVWLMLSCYPQSLFALPWLKMKQSVS
jgi:hypothetical protein